MNRISELEHKAQRAPSHPYTRAGGPTSYQIQHQVAELARVVANEISRAMPSNQARETALKAMRLSESLETYTPQAVRRAGWEDVRVHDADPVTGSTIPVMRRIAVYEIGPGEPGSPTRYRMRTGDLHGHNFIQLLSLYYK